MNPPHIDRICSHPTRLLAPSAEKHPPLAPACAATHHFQPTTPLCTHPPEPSACNITSISLTHLFKEGRHEEAKSCHGQADQQQQQEGEAKGVAGKLQERRGRGNGEEGESDKQEGCNRR